MSTMKKLMKAKSVSTSIQNQDKGASVNRAGGVAWEIKNPAVKLITMTAGAFFAEPKYYNDNVWKPNPNVIRKDAEDFVSRIEMAGEKIKKFVDCPELDSVSQEILAAAISILNGPNPKDLFSIAAWLRNDMNIRLTPQVLMVVASIHPKGQQFVRQYMPKVAIRPDEIKTCLMLHRFFFGPKCLKNCLSRGLADALHNFGERGLLKYNSSEFPKWKDVLHWIYRKKDYPLPMPLRTYMTHGTVDRAALPIVAAREDLKQCKIFDDKARELVTQSMANWEVVLSQFGQSGENKRAVWEYLIAEKLLGYMAMLRNLRNVASANVSDATIESVYAMLSDAEEVKKSRQLPFRFVAAYDAVEGQPNPYGYSYDEEPKKEDKANPRHKQKLLEAIENAIDLACQNVPEMPGMTAVFADNSGSMTSPVSDKSQITCLKAANVLAGMIAKRSEGSALLCAFGTDVAQVHYTKNTTIIDISKKLEKADTNGCSTNAHRCVQWMAKNNVNPDRVIILSDMQCWNDGYGGFDGSLNGEWQKFKQKHPNCWLHSVNLHGYGDTPVNEATKKVNLVGGFSEKIFSMLLETESVVKKEEKAPIPTIDQIRSKW